MDLGVGDRDHPVVGGERHLVVGGADQLAGERLAAVARIARAHARAAADEAAEVVGLGQRALGPGRGDLERVALAQPRRGAVTRSHSVERDAVGMVDEEPDERVARRPRRAAPRPLARSRPGAPRSRPGCCSWGVLAPTKKKRARARFPKRHGRHGSPARESLCGQDSTAMAADAEQVVDRFLASLEGDTRRVAAGEWGLSVEAGRLAPARRHGAARRTAPGPGAGRRGRPLWTSTRCCSGTARCRSCASPTPAPARSTSRASCRCAPSSRRCSTASSGCSCARRRWPASGSASAGVRKFGVESGVRIGGSGKDAGEAGSSATCEPRTPPEAVRRPPVPAGTCGCLY